MNPLAKIWRGLARGKHPLPGSLCDETSTAPPRPGAFYADLGRELQNPQVAAEFAANQERIKATDAAHNAQAGRWQPRHDDAQPGTAATSLILEDVGVDELTGWHDRAVRAPAPTGHAFVALDNRDAVFTPDPATLARRTREQLADEVIELQLQLIEISRERDEEAGINEDLRKTNFGLRKRIEGLELTVLAYARTATNPPPGPQDHGDDLVTPWPAPTT